MLQAAIHHTQPSSISSIIEYQIIYSISYQVPVLYFLVHDILRIKTLSIDWVYENLVPHHLRDAAKEVGVMGGIGMTVSDMHPYFGGSVDRVTLESSNDRYAMLLGASLQHC